MKRDYTITVTSPNNLSATDLCAERDAAYDRYSVTTDKDEAPIAAYIVCINGRAECAQALIIDDRIGIAWGGDATWGDTRGNYEAAIADWVADEAAWEARN